MTLNEKLHWIVIGLTSMVALFAIYQMVFGVWAGCQNPIRIFKGMVTDQVFDRWTHMVFTRNPNVNQFRVISDSCCDQHSYYIWVANGYCAFSVNGSDDFSFFQKRRFFRRLKAYREEHQSKKDAVVLKLVRDEVKT